MSETQDIHQDAGADLKAAWKGFERQTREECQLAADRLERAFAEVEHTPYDSPDELVAGLPGAEPGSSLHYVARVLLGLTDTS